MSSHGKSSNKVINLLQEYSLPLVLGVVAALIFANAQPELYDKVVHHTYAFFVEVDHGHENDHEHDDHGNEKAKEGKTSKVSVVTESKEETSSDDGHAKEDGKHGGHGKLRHDRLVA